MTSRSDSEREDLGGNEQIRQEEINKKMGEGCTISSCDLCVCVWCVAQRMTQTQACARSFSSSSLATHLFQSNYVAALHLKEYEEPRYVLTEVNIFANRRERED